MSTIAVNLKSNQALTFFGSTIGKKAVMALTGLILFGFVVGHLAGNLQIYLGPEKVNHYAKLLHSMPGPLWGARLVLLASVILHIWSSFQLWLLKREARPIAYKMRANLESSYASRTMMWSGPIVGAFIVYHLLHFTFGTVLPGGLARLPDGDVDVYRNLITGFSQPLVSAFYMMAVTLLGIHLYHGLSSMFQSLGINHPRYTPRFQQFAAVASVLITAGNLSIPAAVLAGFVR